MYATGFVHTPEKQGDTLSGREPCRAKKKKTCQVTGTLNCQSPMTRLLRTLARWTSWVVTFSQTGAGALRPKTPALVAVVLVTRGSFQMVRLLSTLGGRAGILHGRNQSVARAELLAAVEALRLCKRATQQVFIWADCIFVIGGFATGRRRKHLSHADLWEEFWNAHDAIGGDCGRAHLTTGSTW